MQEKLTEQKQAIEGFHYPTEKEKRAWSDGKQHLRSKIVEMRYNIPPTLLLNDELAKHAGDCDIKGITVTPQPEVEATQRGDPTDELPSGVRASKSLFKISFHADYESLGRFLQWFDDHQQQTTILSLNIKRATPLASVEIEVEAHQLYCNF